MIESIQFKNFKCLRDTTLPLSPCTVLVGPNGSGKTTVLQSLDAFSGRRSFERGEVLSAHLREGSAAAAEVLLHWAKPRKGIASGMKWEPSGCSTTIESPGGGNTFPDVLESFIRSMRTFSYDASAIATPIHLQMGIALNNRGEGLPGILTQLQDHDPERFDALNEQLARWLPEFDRVLLDFDGAGQRVFFLRTHDGHHRIPAHDISQGTLIALAILTLAYLPAPPSLIGLEEPDRGIHPRLLRRVQDAIYRLSHPESCGEKREPVQVIATTHSPYFLDLFKDHPEEIVIANKVGLDVEFQRLSEQPHIQEILGDASLGEIWYTGILGGVPANS